MLPNYRNLSQDEFYELLIDLQEKYTNSESIITDEEFDFLQEFYENKFNKKFNETGSLPLKNGILLPYKMPSLAKIKGKKSAKELENWLENDTSDTEYILEDKLDGVSLSYICSKNNQLLFTRGNGEIGEDKKYLLEYLNFPISSEKIFVRGEFVLHNSTFRKFADKNSDSKNKLKKPRNLVSGLINAKDSLDIKLLQKCHFYAYQLILFDEEDNPIFLEPYKQLKKLKKMGFETPWFKKVKNVSLDLITEELTFRRQEAKYDIDGLVIAKNILPIELPRINRPKDAIAFKIDTVIEATVEKIVWNASSKDGYLNPVIYIKPVNILGIDIKKATGHNAKFIFSNNISPGSIILFTHAGNTIPRALEGITEGNGDMYPDLPKESYSWNKSKVEFVLIDLDSDENVRKARIEFFIHTLNIKCLGSEGINTLFENGFDTLKKIITMKAKDIENLERFGKTNSEKICQNIKDAITNVPLEKIMHASNIFGEGFGETLSTKILKKYNINDLNSLSKEEIVNKLIEINGIAKIRAEQFADNINNFLQWLKKNKEIIILSQTSEKLQTKIISFTGSRPDIKMKTKMEEIGYISKDGVTKDIDILVIKDENYTSGNIDKAIKYGKEIMTMKKFKEYLFQK